LKAEREQGITIDVAVSLLRHRAAGSSSSPTRRATSSTRATWRPGPRPADVAILLVDARNGVRAQSRRHAQIARLLGIDDYVLAVNKMDLVDFDRTVFEDICDEFDRILPNARLHPIPAERAARRQRDHEERTDAVVRRRPLLEFLETGRGRSRRARQGVPLPVQLVLRPDHDFRGYAGQIVSGTIRPGDEVRIWPSAARHASNASSPGMASSTSPGRRCR
jgi:sulfate adenylyltransferase subunit 1 (EFTu-like GTPase family)